LKHHNVLISKSARRRSRAFAFAGQSILFLVTATSACCIFFIFYYIARDAFPFFQLQGFKEFFTEGAWYPSAEPGRFGGVAIFAGSVLVTLGAAVVAVPLGITAAVCLSDILPFSLRQLTKPVIEILAAIPSVAFGFFALVVFAPALQEHGGTVLATLFCLLGIPPVVLGIVVVSAGVSARIPAQSRSLVHAVLMVVLGVTAVWVFWVAAGKIGAIEISSGTNALNVSVILGIMALPTIVSVSEDALQAVGRELREGAYALGATRAEVLLWVVLPAARSGICAGIILGIMRVIGETMVVWMASGNAAQIPTPWYNLLEPVRTLTATIAGDMGEADHVTGSARYHVLFAMALCLLVVSYAFNLLSEWIVRRSVKRLKG
jgi:phosphate transport system permease protein